jgi:hypothetical protein
VPLPRGGRPLRFELATCRNDKVLGFASRLTSEIEPWRLRTTTNS